MAGVIIDEKLIELGLDAPTREVAIRTVADKLYALNYVHPGYYENVVKREQEFPTGLPSIIPVAVCHTEAQYVKESAMAVATLAHPIEFREMGTPERSVQAEIIFLIALKDSKQQVPWLKKMATVFKSEATLRTIKESRSAAELAAFLQDLFAN
jgi:galactitol PTS system EIIA component